MKSVRVLSTFSVLLIAASLLTACTTPRMTVMFTGDDCIYEGPASIPYGKFNVKWIVNDQTHNKTVLLIITLAEGKTIDDLKAYKGGEQPPWVEVLWNYDENAFGSELEDVRLYRHVYDLKTLDSYQSQPLYMVCGNEEGRTNSFGPIEVTK